ncbi:hypothetical protein cyc_01944 [Cyclospora cayetanensis]|uniref:Uncharacterized protein n=1 Tax=Cyclospora cayetanensis TaxID=88456 RepID=A0A1D3CVQ1_9EIME|nr:hypothetical protein cyc_01944 [Cyclospora cayetanensis]
MGDSVVADIKKYRQVHGKDWWLVSYAGGDGTYSWQPQSEVQRTSARLRSSMAEMRRRYIRSHSFSQKGDSTVVAAAVPSSAPTAAKRAATAAKPMRVHRNTRRLWFQQRHFEQQCLSGLLWLLAGATATLVGFCTYEAWEDLREAPLGMKLYTLTLPCGRSSSPARRRRATPYSRKRRARSPRAAAMPGISLNQGEINLDASRAPGSSSDSTDFFASDEQQFSYSSPEDPAEQPLLLGEGPLTKQLIPRPSLDTAILPPQQHGSRG